jgi:uncharacterized protein with HEPN domain
MCKSEEQHQIVELIEMMLNAIDIIIRRTSHIKGANDFLTSADNSFLLDGICMNLIFIGESVKNIDKLSKGQLLLHYPEIPWKEVMKLRDVIAHHYFDIDAEIIFVTIKDDLPPLSKVLFQMKVDLLSELS